MNAQAIVEKLGFRPSEARVYVALVGLQEATITDLARKVNIPRTTVQGIVEDLHKQGLANFYVVKNKKMWCSESPRKLLARHQEIQKHLTEVIPTLEKLRPQHKAASHKTFNLEGRHGVRFVLDDILVARESVAIIGNLGLVIEAIGERDWERFLETAGRVISHIQLLSPSEYLPESAVLGPIDVRETNTTFLSAEGATMIVYGDKTVILSAGGEHLQVTIVDNSNATHITRSMFICAWNTCA